MSVQFKRQGLSNVGSAGKMIVGGEWIRIWKKAVVLPRLSPGNSVAVKVKYWS